MIVCFDLDGVITMGKLDYPHYVQCEPNLETIENMKELKSLGVSVIIHTARHASDEFVTKQWLEDNDVLYDRIVFDKPLADMYIDDKGFYFGGYWSAIMTEIRRLVREEGR